MYIVWILLAALYAATGIQLLLTADAAGAMLLFAMAAGFGALAASSWKKRQAKRRSPLAGKKIGTGL